MATPLLLGLGSLILAGVGAKLNTGKKKDHVQDEDLVSRAPKATSPKTAGSSLIPAAGTSPLRLETGSIVCFVRSDGRLMGVPGTAEGGGGNWDLQPVGALNVAVSGSKRVNTIAVSCVFVVTRANQEMVFSSMAAQGQLLQPGHKPADPLRVSGHRSGLQQTWRISGSSLLSAATSQPFTLTPHLLQSISLEELKAYERGANRTERELQAMVKQLQDDLSRNSGDLRAAARDAAGRTLAAEHATAEFKHELKEAQDELEKVKAEATKRGTVIAQLEARLADVGLGMGSIGSVAARASPVRAGTPLSVLRQARGTPPPAKSEQAAELRRAHDRELKRLAQKHEDELSQLRAQLESAWRESEANEQLAQQYASASEDQRSLIADLSAELERLSTLEDAMQQIQESIQQATTPRHEPALLAGSERSAPHRSTYPPCQLTWRDGSDLQLTSSKQEEPPSVARAVSDSSHLCDKALRNPSSFGVETGSAGQADTEHRPESVGPTLSSTLSKGLTATLSDTKVDTLRDIYPVRAEPQLESRMPWSEADMLMSKEKTEKDKSGLVLHNTRSMPGSVDGDENCGPQRVMHGTTAWQSRAPFKSVAPTGVVTPNVDMAPSSKPQSIHVHGSSFGRREPTSGGLSSKRPRQLDLAYLESGLSSVGQAKKPSPAVRDPAAHAGFSVKTGRRQSGLILTRVLGLQSKDAPQSHVNALRQTRNRTVANLEAVRTQASKPTANFAKGDLRQSISSDDLRAAARRHAAREFGNTYSRNTAQRPGSTHRSLAQKVLANRDTQAAGMRYKDDPSARPSLGEPWAGAESDVRDSRVQLSNASMVAASEAGSNYEMYAMPVPTQPVPLESSPKIARGRLSRSSRASRASKRTASLGSRSSRMGSTARAYESTSPSPEPSRLRRLLSTGSEAIRRRLSRGRAQSAQYEDEPLSAQSLMSQRHALKSMSSEQGRQLVDRFRFGRLAQGASAKTDQKATHDALRRSKSSAAADLDRVLSISLGSEGDKPEHLKAPRGCMPSKQSEASMGNVAADQRASFLSRNVLDSADIRPW